MRIGKEWRIGVESVQFDQKESLPFRIHFGIVIDARFTRDVLLDHDPSGLVLPNGRTPQSPGALNREVPHEQTGDALSWKQIAISRRSRK